MINDDIYNEMMNNKIQLMGMQNSTKIKASSFFLGKTSV